MILSSVLFHLSALFTIQLIALTGALFLYIYVGKQVLSKWYSMASVAILGLVLLTMAGTFIGAICMHCHREHREHNERGMQMMMHGGFDSDEDMPGEGHHRRIIRIERDGMEGMNMQSCPGMGACEGMGGCEGKEECKGKAGMDCCHEGKGSCTMTGGAEQKDKKIIIKRDTVIEKKTQKK